MKTGDLGGEIDIPGEGHAAVTLPSPRGSAEGSLAAGSASSSVSMRALLLVDHGSRRAEGNQTVEQVAELVRARVEAGVLVAHAHMELAGPSVVEAVDALVGQGAREIVVHPFFLGNGRHASEDIPRLAREALEPHPQVRWRMTDPLGAHELLAELVLARVGEAG